ncbi:MAG: PEP-utilizing enzyme [Candidatus Woesearchaeota archaeon]
MKIVEKIKSMEWDNRVKRFGFLQPKGIINEAETIPLEITKGIILKYDNIFWVMDYNLYDCKKTKEFPSIFEKAKKKKKGWPLHIIDHFDNILPKLYDFIEKLKKTEWKDSSIDIKIEAFLEYVNLLFAIQKYYQIAVPLTNYSEEKLKDYPEIIEKLAIPYKELEISNIRKDNDYSWIKTTYNVIGEVSDEDIEKEYLEKKNASVRIPDDIKHFVDGMQIGIYTRNRMKELSQMLWYYFESLARSMASDLGISRDDFFYLTYKEVLHFYETKELPKYEERKKGFTIGLLDNNEVILTGKEHEELVNFLEDVPKDENISGNPACKGYARGKVKVIMNLNDFSKFEKGDVLVTSMTTPEFVVIMKKASAIITDEGGLSCHAAIVSREMNIPCIIGTKHASKILKDKDAVEVDANKGIVRKLK